MKSHWFRVLAVAGLLAAPSAVWADEEKKPEGKPAEASASETKPAADSKPADSRPAAPDREALFDRLDANKDGAITEDEIPEQNRRMFARLVRLGDANKDGKLSREEFLAVREPERPAPQPGQGGPGQRGPQGEGPTAEQILQNVDRNNDGKLARDEVPEDRRDFFDRMAQAADKDKDGLLTVDELRAGLAAVRGQAQPGQPQPGSPPGNPPQPGSPQQQRSPEEVARFAEEIFSRGDQNNDGKLVRDEVSEERREGFDRMLSEFDADKDNALSKEEFRKAFLAMRDRRPPEGGQRPEGQRSEGQRRPDGKRKPEGDKPSDSQVAQRPQGDRPRDGQRPGQPGQPGQGGQSGGEMAKRLIEQQDKNGDGKLGKDEVGERLKENFDRADKNSDGFIDLQELQQVFGGMRRPGQPGQPSQPSGTPGTPGQAGQFIERMMKEADKNGDGKLSKDELPERMRENFDRLDKNGDGFIDPSELRGMRERRRENSN
ncbi:MAG: EF-hand domain-containing protein [Planctomycetes bacterium]|nr:EF-hand domain-containing protein [Planctomycetota bacterium]